VALARPSADQVDEPRLAGKAHLRSLWLKVHRWIGIVGGFFLAVIGLSGALLYFLGAFIELQHGPILQSRGPDAPLLEPAAWIEAASRRLPEGSAIEAVGAPGATFIGAETVLVVAIVETPGGGHVHRMVSLEPATGDVRGDVVLEKTYAVLLPALHSRLVVPFVGADIVAVLGVALLISTLSGIYLWWPRRGGWKNAFWLARNTKGARFVRDGHKLAGLYLAIVLVPVTVSGVWLLKPQWVDPLAAPLGRIRLAPAAESLPQKPTQTPAAQISEACRLATMPSAVATALTALPDETFRLALAPAPGESAHFRVHTHRPGDGNARDGGSTVYISPACGGVAQIVGGTNRSTAEGLKRMMAPVHNGRAAGPLGVVLVFLSGIALPLLYGTGLYLWLRRGKAKVKVSA
jgi:uncharacterized iron-regulated membrane protein